MQIKAPKYADLQEIHSEQIREHQPEQDGHPFQLYRRYQNAAVREEGPDDNIIERADEKTFARPEMPKMTSFAHQINGPLRASRETVSHGRYCVTGRPRCFGTGIRDGIANWADRTAGSQVPVQQLIVLIDDVDRPGPVAHMPANRYWDTLNSDGLSLAANVTVCDNKVGGGMNGR